MPYVNLLANALNGFKHTDLNVQRSQRVYPGDVACRVGTSPHAKWHEQAGNGLLDLMFLAAEGDALLRRHQLTSTEHAVAAGSRWSSFWKELSPMSMWQDEL